MKYVLLFIICLCTSLSYSQIDSQQSSTKIEAEISDNNDNSNAVSPIKPTEKPGLSNIDDNKINGMVVPERNSLHVPKREFSMFPDNKFANPAELFIKNLERQQRIRPDDDDENSNNGDTTDQYLGDFRSKAKFIKLVYRDFGEADGDIIRVFVNDDVVQPSVLLTSGYKAYKLDLQDGFNKIDFQALNQGTVGPNTAEFMVVDDAGNVITANYWNLATGVKATVIVVKE